MITIAEHKEPQSKFLSEFFLTPKKLYLPLSQHTVKPSSRCVKVGDLIEEGQVIANQDGYIFSYLHAPVSGKVVGVDVCNHSVLGRAETIILAAQSSSREYLPREGVGSLSKEKLIEIVTVSGIVGMGGAAFPTQVKLKSPKPIDTLIINGCECEPYLTCDDRLMVENLKEIFLGIEIICRIIEPKEVIFAVE